MNFCYPFSRLVTGQLHRLYTTDIKAKQDDRKSVRRTGGRVSGCLSAALAGDGADVQTHASAEIASEPPWREEQKQGTTLELAL